MKLLAKKYFAIALLVLFSVTANARVQEIRIDQAVNSPALSIRFTKMKAALIELRINGVSKASRSLDGKSATGETSFTLDSEWLSEGDNKVEVLAFDGQGHLLGSQTSSVHAERKAGEEVSIEGVRGGDTVRGPIEVKLGVNREFKEMYVSFFVDGQWKGMKNYPPYNFAWDTTSVQNGWHEVQAWVVDENNQTFKTHKVRLMVANPGGHTQRIMPKVVAPKVVAPKVVPPHVSPAKVIPVVSAIKPAVVPHVQLTTTSVVTATTAKPHGMKEVVIASATPTDQKLMTPTGHRNVTLPAVHAVVTTKPATAKPVVAKPILPPVTKPSTTLHMVSIAKGARLPQDGVYKIVLNSKPVKFDVEPRIQNGIPLSPFRHLFEAAGGKVKWNNNEKVVSAIRNGDKITIKIGSDVAIINDEKVKMEIAAFIEKSRTLVPLSFLSDALHINIDFDPATKHVLIRTVR